uniref:Si:ch211-226m7.4 n=1 Tax=Neolamprologus brichardi TaxID=32507 RepID=A0A3Q4MME8_NEOBR
HYHYTDKWAQTGWRIEQKYANKVLLGNWAEERLQRRPLCEGYIKISLYCIQGLPSKTIFGHHDPPSSHYLVTQYAESYGRNLINALPTLQHRHADNLTQKPKRSDQLTSALPNNVGPLQTTNHHFEIQQSHLPSLTEYRSAYQRQPLSAFCQSRFAKASHMLSSHLYEANRNNKDLDLRQHLILQVPDHYFIGPPYGSGTH